MKTGQQLFEIYKKFHDDNGFDVGEWEDHDAMERAAFEYIAMTINEDQS